MVKDPIYQNLFSKFLYPKSPFMLYKTLALKHSKNWFASTNSLYLHKMKEEEAVEVELEKEVRSLSICKNQKKKIFHARTQILFKAVHGGGGGWE